jgi:hypothetical protein
MEKILTLMSASKDIEGCFLPRASAMARTPPRAKVANDL